MVQSHAQIDIVLVKNIIKKYGDITVLNNISFTIKKGEIFGLLGPNGAGKSSLINILSTYSRPTSGEAWIAGKSIIANANDVRGLVGVVPQEIALYATLSAMQNLYFFGRLYQIQNGRLKEKCLNLINLVGLYDRRNDRVSVYSGGMQRRLNLAVGLINDPVLLMLDEPTVGLDPQSRVAILEAIKDISDQGISILYTTHYIEEAERLCHCVAILDEGKILAIGALNELLAYRNEWQTRATELEKLFFKLTDKNYESS